MDSTNTPAPTDEAMTRGRSPSSAGSALGDVHAAAVEMGRKERLDNADGTWRCWGCDGEYPFHVSLHCGPCRSKAIASRLDRERAERRLDDERYRWRGMTRNMATDSRLDHDAALRFVATAKRLSSATPERLDALSAAFDRRFTQTPKFRPYTTFDYDANGAGDWVR